MLQISENTSKSQLSRARALLQQYLLDVEKKTVKKEIGYGIPKAGAAAGI
jgi:hypothetical protein